jgi:hypothetical protein
MRVEICKYKNIEGSLCKKIGEKSFFQVFFKFGFLIIKTKILPLKKEIGPRANQ